VFISQVTRTRKIGRGGIGSTTRIHFAGPIDSDPSRVHLVPRSIGLQTEYYSICTAIHIKDLGTYETVFAVDDKRRDLFFHHEKAGNTEMLVVRQEYLKRLATVVAYIRSRQNT
jgi:hypothetical protein